MKVLLSAIFAVSFLLLATTSNGSLLPFLDRVGNPLADWVPDPFRILEQIPFGLERDDAAAVPPASVDWKETPNAHQIIIDVPGGYFTLKPPHHLLNDKLKKNDITNLIGCEISYLFSYLIGINYFFVKISGTRSKFSSCDVKLNLILSDLK